eukprot:2563836-Ditylum_brightwellii.AAC.1
MLSAMSQEFNHVGTAKRGRLLGWQIEPRPRKQTCVSSKKKDKDKEGNLYGDLMICHLWKHQVDTVIDARITDTDVKSYISCSLETVLAAQDKEKKGKYLTSCLEQNRHFSPFVVSVDGMLGKEAAMVLWQLSRKLAVKWDCPISQATNYVKTTMSLSIVKATNCCLRGSRVRSASMSTRRIPCEDGTGIYFLQSAED